MPVVKQNILICVLLFISGMLIFTRGLNVHGLEYRDDEIFYFRSTQEMYQNSNFLSPTYFGENRFQKPILFYWLVLLSYKLFGVSWSAARIVSSTFAALTLCLTWIMAKDLFDRKVATLSVTILMTISLFFRHAKNVVPDMALNFFIVLAIFSWLKFSLKADEKVYAQEKNTAFIFWEVLFFVSCSLGFMIKGFTALIVPFLTVFICIFILRDLIFRREMNFLKGVLIFFLIATPWFLYMIKVYGLDYIRYVLINETKERLINPDQAYGLKIILTNFIQHFGFYGKTIFSYFAPWSLFFIFALPLSIYRTFSDRILDEEKDSIKFLLTWIFVVWFFFSSMYFRINHYMLVLTTPFSILVSYFFLCDISAEKLCGKVVNFIRKYIIVLLFPLGVSVFIIIAVYLAGQSKYLLPVYISIFLIVWVYMITNKRKIVRPVVFALFLIFVFSQSSLMNKAGLTSQATLQKFAEIINADKEGDFSVGVGSHDIHEKEFQVYFDKKVKKLGVSWHDGTKQNLLNFFNSNSKVYCLMIEKDYRQFLKEAKLDRYKIIQEDYILRRRMHLDKGFLRDLINADQTGVHDYLMEKIILLFKKENT